MIYSEWIGLKQSSLLVVGGMEASSSAQMDPDLDNGILSGCFGAAVGAPGALDGEMTPPRCGWVSMKKKNVAGVGICGSMTSL